MTDRFHDHAHTGPHVHQRDYDRSEKTLYEGTSMHNGDLDVPDIYRHGVKYPGGDPSRVVQFVAPPPTPYDHDEDEDGDDE